MAVLEMFLILKDLIISFGQIGFFALGGGNSMITLIQHECVTNRNWLTLNEFSTITGVTFLFPGLTGIKLAGLIGYKIAGFPGLIVSIFALNLPGLLMALIFTRFIIAHQEKAIIQKLLIAVQYGAIVLLAGTIYVLGKSLVELHFNYKAIVLSAIFFIFITFLNFSPFICMLIFTVICTIAL